MDLFSFIFNPPHGLLLWEILLISFFLGLLHGVTPDEHTWPITFSYAVGSYSTKGGMKAGFLFSLGFTLQRAFLTFLGYIGLAAIYIKYNLDGPVYLAVGIVMAVAGSYVLRGKYFHLPFDKFLGAKRHHTEEATRVSPTSAHPREVPLKMTIVHGLIAGFGFGAYATVLTFILAPQVPGVIYSPLPGLLFGIGTMVMQIVIGAAFGSMLRKMALTEDDIKYVGKSTAGKTLYYGGIAFAIIGLIVSLLPTIDNYGISTGVNIPNLDAINLGFILVIFVVGIIGTWSIISSYREIKYIRKIGMNKLSKEVSK
jgi:threonine/homoserine/homoserine lactone efflux protein